MMGETMNKVAALSADERRELFTETAARRGLAAALVEKDYWVCWTLLQLFTLDALQGHIVFKGGTSLSKVFNAISRFSEDIDLIVDYEMLGFVGERHPDKCPSRNKRTSLLSEMISVCSTYIEGPFADMLRERIASILGPGGGWDLRTRRTADNSAVVEFEYPQAVAERVGYVNPFVLLEPGTNAEFIPKGSYGVRAFAAEEFPGLFEQPVITVQAITAERTFWEKATILHAEYHRPADKPILGRQSRHYYDLAMLAASGVRTRAVRDAALRERVVKHKSDFYYTRWARYDLAVPGTLRLVPPEAHLPDLRRDYESMQVMLFGNPPSFDEILRRLEDLEAEINESRSA
jgi:hypothetical protein